MAVEGTGYRELQPLNDLDDVAPSSVNRVKTPAARKAAALAKSATVASLRSAPPHSSDQPSLPPSPKPAATNAAPLVNLAQPLPTHLAPPPPVHAVQQPPNFSGLGNIQGGITPVYRANPLWVEGEYELRQLLQFQESNKDAWSRLVGWYFLSSGRTPGQVIGLPAGGSGSAPYGWELDLRKLDVLAKDITGANFWSQPARGTIEEVIYTQVVNDNRKKVIFEEAIRRWANEHTDELKPVLEKACFTRDLWWTDEWYTMSKLKQMDEGPTKEAMLARAKLESPRYYERCISDENCGR